MSSLNRGLGEFVGSAQPSQKQPNAPTRFYTAHVLEVVKDEKSPYYDEKIGPMCIGSIKVKIIETQYNQPEDEHFYRAFPLDRGDYTLPLPGEAVICTVAQGNYVAGAGGVYTDLLYYVGIVAMDQQLVVNSAPFLSSDMYHIDSKFGSFIKQLALDASVFAERFNNRIDISSTAYERSAGVTKAAVSDTILEGRFGGLIRLTSNSKNRWSTDQVSNVKAGLPTDPFIVMKASRRWLALEGAEKSKASNERMLVKLSDSGDLQRQVSLQEQIDKQNRAADLKQIDDDPNSDETSVYVTTTQNIPAVIHCSEKLTTWNYEQVAGTTTSESDESTATLQTIYGGGYDEKAKIELKLVGTIEIKKQGT